ncbi:MAG: TIGR00282 family metallophosphoesterase [Acidobacteria bacterium]|nr:TIGR00282 family metallophosphoesterase [Acidobacteriota bacterium]
MNTVSILFIGDIFGRPGRTLVADHLRDLMDRHHLDLVIANGENAAAGFGITPRLTAELLALGIDVLTTGNHIWDRREIMEYFPQEPRLLRPANFVSGPGRGLYQGTTRSGVAYAVLNLQGRVFMGQSDCPFRTADRELTELPASCKIRIVDMHAEASSEKIAMGWYLDGRATAVIGTHTHVPTADERVLPQGTAYITDVGMTGPYDSVIGITKETILQKFLTQMPARFEPAEGDARLCAALIQAEADTGRAIAIERLMLRA